MRNIFPDTDGREEAVSGLRSVPNIDGNFGAAASDPQGYADVDDDGAKTISELLLMIRRRKWLIGICTLLGTAAALSLAMNSKPQYTATAALIIQPSEVPIEGMQATSGSLSADPASIITQVDIIRSQRFLTQLATDLDLFQQPGLNPTLGNDGKGEEDSSLVYRLIGRLAAALGLKSEEEEDNNLDAYAVREQVVSNINSRFVVAQQGEGRMIKIKFTYPDRVIAADVVNRAGDLYIENQLNGKLTDSKKVSDWVSNRLAVLQEEVRRSEEKVEVYRSSQRLNVETTILPGQLELTRLNTDLLNANTAYFELKSKLDTANKLFQDGNTDSLMNILSSPLLVTLRNQEIELQRLGSEYATIYGINHPKMASLRSDSERLSAKMDSEIKNLKLDLERQVSNANSHQEKIENRITANKNQSYKNSAAKVGLRELEREVEANRTLLSVFLQHYKEIEQQNAIIEADAEVVSYARPPGSPSSLNPKLFAVLGFIISLTGSGLLAMVIEAMDGKVRSMRQIQRRFGINVLGVVPLSSSVSRYESALQYLIDRPMSHYAESLRYIVTSLEFLDVPPKVLLISSALSGEGKTTFVVGLGAAAARSGKNVVVVDLDIRHPCIATAAQVSPSIIGIVEVVIDGASLEEAIVRSKAGFDCLVNSGRQNSNPGGVIGDQAVVDLIDQLRHQYDLVIIDTPPLLAVGDTRSLSRIADGVLLCMRWGQTSLSACRLAFKSLTEAQAPVVGAVLLGVDKNKYHLYENEDGANYYNNIKKYYDN